MHENGDILAHLCKTDSLAGVAGWGVKFVAFCPEQWDRNNSRMDGTTLKYSASGLQRLVQQLNNGVHTEIAGTRCSNNGTWQGLACSSVVGQHKHQSLNTSKVTYMT